MLNLYDFQYSQTVYSKINIHTNVINIVINHLNRSYFRNIIFKVKELGNICNNIHMCNQLLIYKRLIFTHGNNQTRIVLHHPTA